MTASGSLPRALISKIALGVSARAAVGMGGETADLRGDAYGHGVLETARIVQEAGIRRVLVDDEATAVRLHGLGLDAVTDEEADIDGIRLYGLPGSGLTSAMTLTGRILSVKPLRAGEAVSYGYTHRASHDTLIALVTGGYAQGIVRALGNAAHVEVGGALRPIVGRVAMDVCVIDLQTPELIGAPPSTVAYFGGNGQVRDGLSAWADVTGMGVAELVSVAGSKAVREWIR